MSMCLIMIDNKIKIGKISKKVCLIIDVCIVVCFCMISCFVTK
jgi:hypothetical protein